MSYKIIGKYIRDLNFKIPNPKSFFLLSKNISNYKINIDIKSNQFKNNLIEIELSLSLVPTQNNFKKINTKITPSQIAPILRGLTSKGANKKFILKVQIHLQ